jgi:hypothetical protein
MHTASKAGIVGILAIIAAFGAATSAFATKHAASQITIQIDQLVPPFEVDVSGTVTSAVHACVKNRKVKIVYRENASGDTSNADEATTDKGGAWAAKALAGTKSGKYIANIAEVTTHAGGKKVICGSAKDSVPFG